MQLSELKDSKDWPAIMAKIAKERDRDAFSQFFDYFAPKIKAFSLARQPGADLVADELVQEVMIKVWQKAHTYKKELSSVSTWLYTLARNCRIDQLRRNKFGDPVSVDDLWLEEEDPAPDPFQNVSRQRWDQRLHLCLRELPNEQLQVLTKVYLHGKTQQETAVELELPLGTVKSRIRLALKKLESLLRSS